MRTPHWPFFDLVVCTPRLELRYPDDELALKVAELTAEPIHDPASMPFSIPWTDTPVADLPRKSMQHYWLTRASLAPDNFSLMMAVLVDGEVVGVQDLMAADFATTRVFKTGSWLTRRVHRRGIGKEMRAAILHLGFEGLGGQTALTSAWDDNEPSLGVTRSLGYEPNGFEIGMRRDAAARMEHFAMTRERWLERRRDDITISGLEPCLPLLGLTPPTQS
jgi:RimJ/RimL family protein N-acetyltransferase